MRYRILIVAVTATALLVPGCSTSKPSVPIPAKSSSAQAGTPAAAAAEENAPAEPSAPVEKLDLDSCVEVTSANLDMATALSHDEAVAAGEQFLKFDPPAEVREAIEHFVETDGIQFDDPDYDKYNSAIDNWGKQVCPL